MSFTDKAEFKIPRHIVQPGGVNIEQISSNRTLTAIVTGKQAKIIPPEEEWVEKFFDDKGS